MGLFQLLLEGKNQGRLVLELGLEGGVVLDEGGVVVGDARYLREELLVQLLR